jgi:hypothetical protein
MIDMDGFLLEQAMWKPTGELRWRRPKGADDNERVLEQLWERVTGERSWKTVGTMLED